VDYILDIWRPNLSLNDIHLETQFSNRKSAQKVNEFYQIDFIEKLLDRGLNLFKYFIIHHSQPGTSDIFMMFWNKFANRLRVEGRIFFRASEAPESPEEDITIPLLQRCFITCNQGLLKYLIAHGLTFQQQDTSLWDCLHFKLENTHEFTKYLIEIEFPQNEMVWDDMLNEMYYDTLDERLFDLAIERAATFPDFQVDSYLQHSISQKDIEKVKVLYQRHTFDLKDNFSVFEKVLAKTSLEIIRFLSEKFPYIDSQIIRDSFIKLVIASDNFILLKYIITHFNIKMDSLDDTYYESLAKCTCPAIVDYLTTLCPIDLSKLKDKIPNDNLIMFNYINKLTTNK